MCLCVMCVCVCVKDIGLCVFVLAAFVCEKQEFVLEQREHDACVTGPGMTGEYLREGVREKECYIYIE